MTAPPRSSSLRLAYGAITVVIFGFDLWTKALVERTLPLRGGSVRLIEGFLSLTLVHNTGAAFGLFSSLDPRWTTAVLNIVGLAAIGTVSAFALLSPAGRILMQTGLALILGGAAGNLVDRISNGWVIDFVEVYWRSFHWPNFNVADSAITIGVACLVVDAARSTASDADERRCTPGEGSCTRS